MPEVNLYRLTQLKPVEGHSHERLLLPLASKNKMQVSGAYVYITNRQSRAPEIITTSI